MKINVFSITTFSCIITQLFKSSLAASLSCTIDNLTHNYFAILDPIYDEDISTDLPYTCKLTTQNVTEVTAPSSQYVSAKLDSDKNVIITITKINEKNENSKNSEFLYHFEISLLCEDKTIVNMYTSVPIIDSNNHEPFFDRSRYTYTLISNYMEDFTRQLFLNPITATDYDVTNNELKFSISENKYFDIFYNGAVAGTLNKRHYALLVPKTPGAIIKEKIEVFITVTDMGNPPRRNISKLIINPLAPPVPVFRKPYYIGHYYKNNTFKMVENPQLEEGTEYYKTDVTLENNNGFAAYLMKDEIIIKSYYDHLFNVGFYQQNVLLYELKAKYTDKVTKMFSTGTATIIVKLHHD